MSEKKTQKHRTVVEGALKVLRLDDLQVDPSYQREVKKKHRKIVTDFDPDALGTIQVGERADGTFWIVDGLQRVTALKKLGRKEVRANVFASRGPEHEAAVFNKINRDRTKPTAGEEFRSLLTAHDEVAWKVKEAAEAEGFRLVFGKSGHATEDSLAKELACLATLYRVAKNWGPDPIRFALKCVKESWPGDRLATYNIVVEGLCIFFNRNSGAVDMSRLIPRLRTITPQKLIYAATQMTVSGSKSGSVADVIEKTYRKKLNPKTGS